MAAPSVADHWQPQMAAIMTNRIWYMLGPRLGWRHRLRQRVYRLLVWARIKKPYMHSIRIYDDEDRS